MKLELASALVLVVVLVLWGWLVKTHQADAAAYVAILGTAAMATMQPLLKKQTPPQVPSAPEENSVSIVTKDKKNDT